jgi:hypothetical protein
MSDTNREVTGKNTQQPKQKQFPFEQLETREVPANFQFDFGTPSSPVAAGYTQVPLVEYTAARGYGWETTAGMTAANRNGLNPLTRDVHLGRSSSFLVDLPNGSYDLELSLGDVNTSRDDVRVTAESSTIVEHLDTSRGQTLEARGRVTVSDGRLNIRIVDLGGANNQFAISGLSIRPVELTATSLWAADAKPALETDNDPNPVELGVKFQSSTPGFITGIRFYKGPRNLGTHTGSLWSETGERLATATFTNETATGWQEVRFAQPVAVAANKTYVASYFAPRGYYSVDDDFFLASGAWNGTLRALSNDEGGNGVYRYASQSGFPNQTYKGSNYWVDAVFQQSITSPPAAPTANAGAPVSGNEGSSATGPPRPAR